MVKVLIVDDDADIVSLFKMILEMKGHEIINIAYNGEEAVERFMGTDKSKHPDVVLMDHRMPKKDGLTATIEILSKEPNANILFISADYTIKEKAIEAGAKDFLEKPINVSKILDSIEHLTNPKAVI
ncbi:MAG: response regulator [Promethearchaeota archaeon]